MAEVAPLASAHTHARKAANETQQVHWSGAADEHRTAARDFARAARTTNDSEALRVLKLLETQHAKIARIIALQESAPDDEPTVEETHSLEPPTVPTLQVGGEAVETTDKKTKSTPSNPSRIALAATRMGSQARESSPSLARDIASRRGIPQTSKPQLSPAAQARARQLSPESHRRVRGAVPPKIPPSITDSQASLSVQRRAKKADEDEGFNKFYSSLTSGAASKLSSVLAYAGLPLTSEEAPAEPSPVPRTKQRSAPSTSDPDVKRYFSKAALKAIEDEHRQKGTLGHGFGPAESFYVVPQGGGSYSYADITKTRLQPGGPQVVIPRGVGGGGGAEDEDDFVDASEVPGPPSPTHARVASLTANNKRNPFGKTRTEEELDLENATLKLTLEQLAARLANFEAHAQDASMAALTQSMMAARPGTTSTATNVALGSSNDAALRERIRQLELQIERQAEGEQKLRDQSEEQRKMLRSYEARYAKLKISAKAKEKAKKEAAQKAGRAGDEAVGSEVERTA